LPALAQVAAADGQSPKTVKDDVAVAAKDAAHDHVAHLVDQDRKEDAGDPQTQSEGANVSEPRQTKEGGDDPENGVDATAHAAEVNELDIRRAIRFELEHGLALWKDRRKEF